MERRDKEDRVKRLIPYRWKPGQSGNVRGRPKKEQEMRWYLASVGLEIKIPSLFYRNAMQLLGMNKQIQRYDELVKNGAKAGDSGLNKIVPIKVKDLTFGQYCALVACFEACKDPYLFLKIIDQVHGKPIQPTTLANPDGSTIKQAPSSNVIIVDVPAGEDEII
jgi:hypothetical protein